VFSVGLSITQNIAANEKYSRVFSLSATFFADKEYVEIKFNDMSQKTTSVTLEILGMGQSYQKVFSGPSFSVQVPFSAVPQYGWKSMPVTLVVEHQEFGKVGIKTEIHNQGDQVPQIIYSEL
jgi:hypothetical protein